ncbi:hypothetical protein [Streptomyces sp. SKN60]|uniref:hypothetical protein n=1 Tax=Streptomyces sp. SKN60 TaxID=2855506 RepID=UPI002246FD83
MPADDGEAGRQIAIAQVQVGVAQSGGDEADEYFAGGRFVEVELDDLEGLSDLGEYCGSGLHDDASSPTAGC